MVYITCAGEGFGLTWLTASITLKCKNCKTAQSIDRLAEANLV